MDTPHESSSSLRIAVLGMGNIGSAFAFQLARVGHHDVTAIARPGSVRFGQLQRDGGVVNAEDERAEMRVVDGLEETIPYDLVIEAERGQVDPIYGKQLRAGAFA